MSLLLAEVCGETMSIGEAECTLGNDTIRYVIDPVLKPTSAFHFGVFFSKALLSEDVFRYPRANRIGVLNESPIDSAYRRIPEIVRRFPLVFTHQRHLLELGEPFRPLLFGTNWIGARDAHRTAEVMDSSPAKTGMVSFIGSLEHPDEGAYRLRREVAAYAMSRKDIECYGKGIRPVAGKREAIGPFRFSIAMENAASDHYFSEKLNDCLLLETVPIYYGCPGIGDLLDERGMLRFNSIEQLAAILDGLNESTYERMRPYVLANREKVVANRWHNHHGLLQRLSDQLPSDIHGRKPRVYRIPSRAERWIGRMLRRSGILA